MKMGAMIEVKTSELTGPALDWAVALATEAGELKIGSEGTICCVYQMPEGGCWTNLYEPSTDWNQGGPLIEQHLLVISPEPSKGWLARSYMDATEYYGPTPLIAAMRCLVASHLGDEVLIPQELLQ